MRTAIVLFDGAEELDFAGPWEVIAFAAKLDNKDSVLTVAEHARPIKAAKGLRVLPDFTFANCPAFDVLVVPGGEGRIGEAQNPVMISWLKKVAPTCKWVTSVCTGTFLLHAAGLLEGRKVTTHWRFTDQLKVRGGVEVKTQARFVRDGNVVTAAGVSAGIDMALWLVGQWHGVDFARDVQKQIEYAPAPPYTADV